MSGCRAVALAAFLLGAACLRADPEPAARPDRVLALELSAEGRHEAAAVEFRRLALGEPDATARGGWFWAAAHEYVQGGQPALVPGLLDRAENSAAALRIPALLLRAEAAAAQGAPEEAAFYLQSAAGVDAAPDLRRFVARRTAEAELRAGRPAAARAALEQDPGDQADALDALDRYAQGRDKRPLVGGTLGLVPGLGYAYAGEYANAARSLILNGLFIGAMVYSGMEDQWGAFAVISFFEITWYSGSLYGGVDAAHRHNRRRRDAAVAAIRGGAAFAPDAGRLPAVSLRFTF